MTKVLAERFKVTTTWEHGDISTESRDSRREADLVVARNARLGAHSSVITPFMVDVGRGRLSLDALDQPGTYEA